MVDTILSWAVERLSGQRGDEFPNILNISGGDVSVTRMNNPLEADDLFSGRTVLLGDNHEDRLAESFRCYWAKLTGSARPEHVLINQRGVTGALPIIHRYLESNGYSSGIATPCWNGYSNPNLVKYGTSAISDDHTVLPLYKILGDLVRQGSNAFLLNRFHNPLGTAWSKEALEAAGNEVRSHTKKGKIQRKRPLIIVDELYGWLDFQQKPLESLEKHFEGCDIISVTSLSKGWDAPAEGPGFIWGTESIICALKKSILRRAPSSTAINIAETAFSALGDPYLAAVRAGCKLNADKLTAMCAASDLFSLPNVPDGGTYAMVVVGRKQRLSSSDLRSLVRRIEDQTGILIGYGSTTGAPAGVMRVNLAATTPDTFAVAMKRLASFQL